MFLLISLFFASLIFFMILAIVIGAPLVPSKPAVAKRMVELLQLKPGETFYDLGSGDGRLLIGAAKLGARAWGIEINPYVVLLSWLLILFTGQLGKATVRWGNFWKVDLSRADVVAIYGLPPIMPRLVAKYKRELKKGTRVVSNSFHLPGLRLIKQETVANNKIYLYHV